MTSPHPGRNYLTGAGDAPPPTSALTGPHLQGEASVQPVLFAFAEPIFVRERTSGGSSPLSPTGHVQQDGIDILSPVNGPISALQAQLKDLKDSCQSLVEENRNIMERTDVMNLKAEKIRAENWFLEVKCKVLKHELKNMSNKGPLSAEDKLKQLFQRHYEANFPDVTLSLMQINAIVDFYKDHPREKFRHPLFTKKLIDLSGPLQLGFFIDQDEYKMIMQSNRQDKQKMRALLFAVLAKEAVYFCSLSGRATKQVKLKLTALEITLLKVIEDLVLEHLPPEDKLKQAESFRKMLTDLFKEIRAEHLICTDIVGLAI